jgi:hypothetical protein
MEEMEEGCIGMQGAQNTAVLVRRRKNNKHIN